MSGLKWKPGLIPRCDVHPEIPMALGRTSIRGVDEPVYRCGSSGCERFFARSLGYQQVGFSEPSPQCQRHAPERPFTVVQSTGERFEYVCQVEGCLGKERWEPPKGK